MLLDPTGAVCAVRGGVLWYMLAPVAPSTDRGTPLAILALVLLAALAVAAVAGVRWLRRNGEWISGAITRRWQRIASLPRFAAFRARHERLWVFVAARFARGEYLGLHLTIGFLVSVLALWSFAAITEDVLSHDPLTLLDLRVLAMFRSHATPLGDRIGTAVSLVGSPVAMMVLAVVVALVLALRRWWIVLWAWVAAFAGGGALDSALKTMIHRPRPAGAAAFLHGASFSFPSGHAMGSLIGYGMLAYLLIAFWAMPRRRLAAAIGTAALLLVVLISLSRLYLGVHYFSDVVGGLAAGTVWLTACISGVEIALRQRGLSPWHVGVERRRADRPPSPPAADALRRSGP